jgi:regulator of replication initiation timing
MTKTGKILTLANLVLALVFASWAVGLYFNAVPWHTPPADGGQRVQGMVEQLRDQITQATKARDAADARFTDATLTVQALEKERPANLHLYAQRLKAARRGNVAGIEPPVQSLEFDGEAVKTTGNPVQFDGTPALTFDGYTKAIQEKIRQIAEVHDQIAATVEETRLLTQQIDGVEPPGGAERITAEQKGLRRRLHELQKQAGDLRLEIEYLRSPLTSVILETAQLKKRQAALTARLNELKSAGSAVGRK